MSLCNLHNKGHKEARQKVLTDQHWWMSWRGAWECLGKGSQWALGWSTVVHFLNWNADVHRRAAHSMIQPTLPNPIAALLLLAWLGVFIGTASQRCHMEKQVWQSFYSGSEWQITRKSLRFATWHYLCQAEKHMHNENGKYIGWSDWKSRVVFCQLIQWTFSFTSEWFMYIYLKDR